MRLFNVLRFAIIFSFACTISIQAQKPRQYSSEEVIKMQIGVSENFLDAIQSMKNYLVSKSQEDYQIVQEKLILTDSLIDLLDKSSKSKLDKENFPKIKQAVAQLKKLTFDKLQEMSSVGEIATFNIDGRTASLSKDGEAPLYVYLSMSNIYAENMLTKLTAVFFSYTWKSSKGTFKMRACPNRNLQERFDQIGIGSKYTPIIVSMVNRMGRDVSFNPFTEKFTVLTREGKQFQNISMDFDDLVAIEHLSQEDQQSIFTKVIDVYEGANINMLVLFPRSLPSSDLWSRIIFDTAMGEFGESLTKASLIKEN